MARQSREGGLHYETAYFGALCAYRAAFFASVPPLTLFFCMTLSCLPMFHNRNNVVGPCFNCLKAVSHQLQRLAVLLTIAALIVNPEEVIALGGLVAEHDAYDVRRNI